LGLPESSRDLSSLLPLGESEHSVTSLLAELCV
jgi:hypothetical protein